MTPPSAGPTGATRSATSTAVGALIGLEHEYEVQAGGHVVDFGPLAGTVGAAALAAQSLQDPEIPQGAVITADEWEAEIALPPVPTTGDFAAQLDHTASASRGWLRRTLEAELHAEVRLEGVSTHLSVSVPGMVGASIAAALAVSVAPALVLLLDRPGSAGILTRCHPERIEFCGEFAAGSHLRAVSVFALGAVVVAAAARRAGTPDPLPALRLSRRARAADPLVAESHWTRGAGLLGHGRSTGVVLSDGTVSTIGAHLEDVWRVVRPSVIARARRRDVDTIDRLVDGRLPLPVEVPYQRSRWTRSRSGLRPPGRGGRVRSSGSAG